jgi:hypothetical protein
MAMYQRGARNRVASICVETAVAVDEPLCLCKSVKPSEGERSAGNSRAVDHLFVWLFY